MIHPPASGAGALVHNEDLPLPTRQSALPSSSGLNFSQFVLQLCEPESSRGYRSAARAITLAQAEDRPMRSFNMYRKFALRRRVLAAAVNVTSTCVRGRQ